MQTNQLNGTNWVLTSMPGLNEVPADMRRKEGFLRFDDTGRVSTSAGCNTILGSWSVADGKFEVKLGPSTMMACPEPLMKLESSLTESLSTADNYQIDGDKLLIRKGDALLATFTKSAK